MIPTQSDLIWQTKHEDVSGDNVDQKDYATWEGLPVRFGSSKRESRVMQLFQFRRWATHG